MPTSERWRTLHVTLPIDTAGTTPSPAATSSDTPKPSPAIVACSGDEEESVTEVITGVASKDALYLHPFDARHSARIDATETVTVGAELRVVKQDGSMG
jgi:hypothetical protein